jgi:hypothetical protein
LDKVGSTDPIQLKKGVRVRAELMKSLSFVIPLLLSMTPSAWAQTKPLPRATMARVDNCAPIGRTADGKLVYSMKCETLPAPAAPPAQAEAAPAAEQAASAPDEPVTKRSGLFGLSYTVTQPGQ